MSDWNTIDADYELISLLNDFTINNQIEQKNIQNVRTNNNLQGSTVKIKVYKDCNGLPTDNFLEELKNNNIDKYEDSSSDSNDIPYVYPKKDNVVLLNTDDYHSDVNSEDSYSESNNSSDNSSFEQRKYVKKRDSNNNRINNESNKSNKITHKSFIIRRENKGITKKNRNNHIKSKSEKNISSINRNNRKTINFVKKNSIIPETKIYNERNFILSGSGANIPNWPIHRTNSSTMNSSNIVKKNYDINFNNNNNNNNNNNVINDYDTNYNHKIESKNLISKNLEIPDQIISDQGTLQNDNIESETKLKTLNLRLSGQQCSIKALETQLAEALQMLEIRNQEISQVTSRLRILEMKDKNKIAKSTINNNKYDGEAYHLVVEELEKCKVMSEIIENRHREEQVRRQRAEERIRLLKAYVDNSKQSQSEIMLEKSNLEKNNSELQKRIMKCKKVIKEQAISFQSQLAYAKDKELELEMLRSRNDKSELSLRHASIEISHLREEYRLVKSDLNIAQEKNKHQSLVLETAKEKDATRRTEQRLNDSETRLIEKRKSNSNIIQDRKSNIKSSYSTSEVKEKIVDRNQNNSKIYKKIINQNDDHDVSSRNDQDETSIKQNEEMLTRLKERRSRLTTQAIQSQKQSKDYLEGNKITSNVNSNSLAIPVDKMSLNNNVLDNNQELLKPSKHFVKHQQQQSKLQEQQSKNISKSNVLENNNTLNSNNKERYLRLQKMYEKCMKKDGTRLAWKGSDDDSDSDH